MSLTCFTKGFFKTYLRKCCVNADLMESEGQLCAPPFGALMLVCK